MKLRNLIIAVLSAAAIIVSLLLWTEDGKNEGLLVVTALDVGQGDALLMRTPYGSDVLIDGGPSSRVIERLSERLPLSDRDIELVIVTHTDYDHVGGLPAVAARYRIDHVLDSGAVSMSTAFEQWSEAIEEQGSERTVARAGTTLTIDDVRFDVLWPERDPTTEKLKVNDTSVVVRVTYGSTSFMFTGDISSSVEEWLIENRSLSHSDVLKVAHHGSAYSSSSAFLDAVMPRYALISAGKNNSYGHPHKVVLDRLQKRNIDVLRTDEQGDIVLTSDGISVHKTP
ncbi:MAG: ComEC/Rec2 family competence protein [Candidatus Kerfeldbacteria bacterium]